MYLVLVLKSFFAHPKWIDLRELTKTRMMSVPFYTSSAEMLRFSTNLVSNYPGREGLMSYFCVFNLFILSTFFYFQKNVHWKFHEELREPLLIPQKRINTSRFYCESGWVQSSSVTITELIVPYALPIATRLLRRHAVGGVSTWSRELWQIE